MNSLMKTAPLVGSTELSTDDRAHQRLAVMAMGVEDTQLLLYPRLIPLHNMELEGEAVPLRCSEDRLSDGGAFLLENGHALFLWLGQACPPELIQGLFNLPSLAHLQPNTVGLEPRSAVLMKTVCLGGAMEKDAVYYRQPYLRSSDLGSSPGGFKVTMIAGT
ncbi:unnamed protein product [Boreogadus saida]